MIDYKEHISIDSNIRFGKPCIKNTRISVADVLGWLAIGMTHEEIISDFPRLTQKDIFACLSFV